MKKLYFLVAVFLPVTFLHAQLNKGQWIVGGNAGFSATSYNVSDVSHNTTRLQLTPGAGYFIMDKLAVGLKAVIYFNNQKDTYTGTPGSITNSKVFSLGVSPFVRYYFLPKTNKINLLADASYTYGTAKYTTKVEPYPSSSSTSKQHAYTLAVGPAFFINHNVALEVTASYQVMNYEPDTQNIFMINAGFQIHL